MAKPKQTKKDKVRAMLERADGATLDAICKATGWQAHSARAALSGFRKAGHTVERFTPGDGKAGAARYRITTSPAATE